jgi:hypothetical protein
MFESLGRLMFRRRLVLAAASVLAVVAALGHGRVRVAVRRRLRGPRQRLGAGRPAGHAGVRPPPGRRGRALLQPHPDRGRCGVSDRGPARPECAARAVRGQDGQLLGHRGATAGVGRPVRQRLSSSLWYAVAAFAPATTVWSRPASRRCGSATLRPRWGRNSGPRAGAHRHGVAAVAQESYEEGADSR